MRAPLAALAALGATCVAILAALAIPACGSSGSGSPTTPDAASTADADPPPPPPPAWDGAVPRPAHRQPNADSARLGDRAMWWYDQRDIPFYYDLYKTFAIADAYHCSLLGPTFPNRIFLFSGTSFGVTVTPGFPDLSAYPFPTNDALVLDEL